MDIMKMYNEFVGLFDEYVPQCVQYSFAVDTKAFFKGTVAHDISSRVVLANCAFNIKRIKVFMTAKSPKRVDALFERNIFVICMCEILERTLWKTFPTYAMCYPSRVVYTKIMI